MKQLNNLKYLIILTDALVISAATLLAFSLRFSVNDASADLAGPIQIGGTILPVLWILVLIFMGAYDRRSLFIGLTEYSRVTLSALVVLALVATVSFLFKFDTSRAYVLIAIPFGTLGLLVSRYVWRRHLLAQRRNGEHLSRTLLIGGKEECAALSTSMLRAPWGGFVAVAEMDRPQTRSEWAPWFAEMDLTLKAHDCQAIALTGSTSVDGDLIRELSWIIEGEGMDLLVSAGLGTATGPRVTLRVAAGLPLLHLDEASLRVPQRVAKRSLDLVGASLGLIVLSPLFLILSALVLVTSGPPVFFRQRRAGRDSEVFRMWKFRTMRVGADSEKEALRQLDGAIGPIFKADLDPRITPFGRWLRRWSLDEIPQLLNVLMGEMSLVGPRPHPLDDVDRYESRDLRRLIAKPGITGLWQVAGRSDLTWDASIELDLLYIENWTFIGDLAILARTFQAVIQGNGAR